MSDFNWEKESLQTIPAAANRGGHDDFDWERDSIPTAPVDHGAAFAALKGVQDLPTLGWGDELGGAVQAGASALAKRAPGVADALGLETRYPAELPTPAQAYTEGRDENRRESREAAADHPLAYYGTGLAASVPAMAAMPGLTAAKGAGLATRVGVGAANGLTQGAIAGAGLSEANTAEGAGADALKNGALGGALGGAVPLVGAASVPMANGLQRFANLRALKAAGAIQKDLKQMTQDEVQNLGQKLLEEVINKPWSSKEQILKAVDERLSTAGSRISSALKTADAAAPQGVDAQAVLDRVKQNVVDANKLNPGRYQHAQAAAAQLDGLGANGPVDFATLNQIKSDLYQGLYDKADVPMVKTMGRKVAHEVKEDISRQVGAVAPSALPDLEAANKAYGPWSEIKDLAHQGVAREAGNKTLPLRASNLLGAAVPSLVGGAVAGNGAQMLGGGAGLLGAAGIKLADKIGNSGAAWTAYKGANLMRNLVEHEPQKLYEMIGHARTQVLSRALQEGGPENFAVHHYVMLQTDPTYSQGLANMEEEANKNGTKQH